MRHPNLRTLLAVAGALGLIGAWACAARQTGPEASTGEAAEATQAGDAAGADAAEAAGTARPGAAGTGAADRAGAAGHPAVGARADCLPCHAQATPEVTGQWREGPHGLAQVKCVTCHGGTGESFVAAPADDFCGSCHPAEADSVGGSGCFGCHGPHDLVAEGGSPHGPSAETDGPQGGER